MHVRARRLEELQDKGLLYRKNGGVIKALQAVIHNTITTKIVIRDRGTHRQILAVFRESAMPAELIDYASDECT